jgi:ankyrin repeat protein
MTSALVHGEFAAVEALLARGAPLDIAAAAATGRGDVVQQLLADADQGARDLSLSYAALHGHADIVALLLRGGVDPNRYNPPGGHSHCTALHSAAFAGHVEAVRALLDGGARGDIGDIHRNMTALQWAEYAGHAPIVVMLTAHASGLGTGSEAGSGAGSD